MNYLLHAGILLMGCFLYYSFLLRRETHFALNRYLLLGALGAVFLLPLITVPAHLSLRSTASVAEVSLGGAFPIAMEDRGIGTENPIRPSLAEENSDEEESLTEPILSKTSPEESSGTLLKSESTDSAIDRVALWVAALDGWRILGFIYLAGVAVFALHFLLQLGLLFWRMLRHPGHSVDRVRIVELSGDFSPYSFLNRIFLNPDHYDPDTFHRIVEHERIHVGQRHTIDILLAEVLVVVQWWNPFAWLYRRAIENNLEYLTDAEMLRRGTDAQAYQLSLLQVAIPNHPRGLTSNYNQSFLERRIMMMKAKKSSGRTGWKYFALPALLALSLSSLNAVQLPVPPAPAPAPSPPSAPTAVPAPAPAPVVAPAPVAVPVPPQGIDPASVRQTWTAEIMGEEVCFTFTIRDGDRHHYSSSDRCFSDIDLSTLPRGSMGTLTLRRAAGSLALRGLFEGDDGLGTFEFTPDPTFVDYLAGEGFRNYDKLELMHFFFTDIDADYLATVKNLGYEPTRKQLLHLAIFGFDRVTLQEVLTDLTAAGFDRPNLDKLIELRIHGVNKSYMQELAAAGYADLTLNDIVEARIHGLDGDFVQEMNQLGFRNLDFARVVEMAIHGISTDYAKELQSLGYDDLEPREIVAAKIHGVDAEKIAELRAAGLDNLTLEEAKTASIHGINAEYVADLVAIGFTNLNVDEVVGAKIHGVSPRKVREMKELGLDFDNLEQVKAFSIHGVGPDFVKGLRELGYTDLDLDGFIEARIHGITPRFVKNYEGLGYGQIPMNKIIELKIHGVSAEFIRKHRREGDSLDDMIQYKIVRGSRR